MAESFFSALKNERVYRTVYATKSQARSDVIRYIEGFYNSRRRSLGVSEVLRDVAWSDTPRRGATHPRGCGARGA
ncbi:UNVERIFIED_ORG: hypothetical protein ABIB19_003585 [Arthrobacter sp. UYEF10]